MTLDDVSALINQPWFGLCFRDELVVSVWYLCYALHNSHMSRWIWHLLWKSRASRRSPYRILEFQLPTFCKRTMLFCVLGCVTVDGRCCCQKKVMAIPDPSDLQVQGRARLTLVTSNTVPF